MAEGDSGRMHWALPCFGEEAGPVVQTVPLQTAPVVGSAQSVQSSADGTEFAEALCVVHGTAAAEAAVDHRTAVDSEGADCRIAADPKAADHRTAVDPKVADRRTAAE